MAGAGVVFDDEDERISGIRHRRRSHEDTDGNIIRNLLQ
jgi:hypothetical protein